MFNVGSHLWMDTRQSWKLCYFICAKYKNVIICWGEFKYDLNIRENILLILTRSNKVSEIPRDGWLERSFITAGNASSRHLLDRLCVSFGFCHCFHRFSSFEVISDCYLQFPVFVVSSLIPKVLFLLLLLSLCGFAARWSPSRLSPVSFCSAPPGFVPPRLVLLFPVLNWA